jgi:hypothetical protein
MKGVKARDAAKQMRRPTIIEASVCSRLLQ